MRYTLVFTTLLSLCLPVTIATDPRYCQNKTVLDGADFTLEESADNAHLPVLSKYFESKGKIANISTVLQSANRALSKGSPSVGNGSPSEAWAWNSGDDATATWVPQGITGSGDALNTGTWDGHDAWVVSWYRSGESVRLSFIDRATHNYRHVMLVNPTADDNFTAIAIHAGGIMWYGNVLFVVDTHNGIRAFDLDNIWEVEIADGVGKTTDGGYSADQYRYVLPQIRNYQWTPGSASPFRFSWISLDRSDSPDTLMVGEFVSAGETFDDAANTPVPIRYVKYDLDYATRKLKTSGGIASASWAYCVDIPNVQGAVSYDGEFYISRSTGKAPKQGDLFTWEEGQTATEHTGWFMAGNEDLSYNLVHKEYYTVTEYAGDRYILAYKV